MRPEDTVEERVARVVGKVGPSMLLTSLSESLAFFLGMLATFQFLLSLTLNVIVIEHFAAHLLTVIVSVCYAEECSM